MKLSQTFLQHFLIVVALMTSFAQALASDLVLSSSATLRAGQQTAFSKNGYDIQPYQFYWTVRGKNVTGLDHITVTSGGIERPFEGAEYTSSKLCVLMMIDTSQSMQGFWTDAADLISYTAGQQQSDYALYGFADDLTVLVPFAAGLTSDEFQKVLGSVTMSGRNTQLYAALDKAIAEVAECETGQQSVIVFSDGDAEDIAVSLSDVTQLANQRNVKIYTVGFGDVAKTNTVLKLQVLKTLADKTGGEYFQYDANDRQSIQDNIARLLAKVNPQGGLVIDPKNFPYGESLVTLNITVNMQGGTQETLQRTIDISGTKTLNNVLVTVADISGSDDPWMVISVASVVVGLLLIILLVLLVLKGKKRKQREKLEKELEAQRHRELQQQQDDVRNALSRMDQKIEEFKPSDPVMADQTPFAWLQDTMGNRYPLINYSTTVGRDSGNDLVLSDNTVSSQHAIVDFKKGQFVWTDRAPTNVTEINSNPVTGSVTFMPGDHIRCGQTQLTLILE